MPERHRKGKGAHEETREQTPKENVTRRRQGLNSLKGLVRPLQRGSLVKKCLALLHYGGQLAKRPLTLRIADPGVSFSRPAPILLCTPGISTALFLATASSPALATSSADCHSLSGIALES